MWAGPPKDSSLPLLLLFTGIHNAWDNIGYHVLVARAKANTERSRDETK
jgi:hypothetical protein